MVHVVNGGTANSRVEMSDEARRTSLTGVLMLTIDDAHRAALLMSSLQCLGPTPGPAATADNASSVLFEVIVVVPDVQLDVMRVLFERPGHALPIAAQGEATTAGAAAQCDATGARSARAVLIRVVGEGELIGWARREGGAPVGERSVDPAWSGYALQARTSPDAIGVARGRGHRGGQGNRNARFSRGIATQMALKLLAGASGLVRTDYYVTLDADVLALCAPSECWRALLLPAGRGAYVDEPRDIHPHWWHGSERMLGLEVRKARATQIHRPRRNTGRRGAGARRPGRSSTAFQTLASV